MSKRVPKRRYNVRDDARTGARQPVQIRALRPYRVIIHDDPIHTYREVAVAVHRAVPGKSFADGWAIATLGDTTGQRIATICPKELAEYYRERFEQTYGLTSTIDAV